MASKILNHFIAFFSSDCYWFSLFGKLYAVYLAYKLFLKLWYWSKLYLLSPTLNLAQDVKSFGKWAVVTGATDGIGKSYAVEMAKRGMSVVLISRSADKLASVAKEITERFQTIEVRCVVADFSQDVSIYSKIENEIKDLDIGVLVNNVGVSYDHPDDLETISDSMLKQLIVVNCFSVVFMSKMVIPMMSERKRGLIINIASFSAHVQCPYLSVYSATKAFVYRFSSGLEFECKSKGIIVQCVSPAFVATQLSKIRRTSFMVPSPDSFVSSAVDTVGLESHVFGYFSHDLQKTFMDLLGECCSNRLSCKAMKSLKAKSLAKKKKVPTATLR